MDLLIVAVAGPSWNIRLYPWIGKTDEGVDDDAFGIGRSPLSAFLIQSFGLLDATFFVCWAEVGGPSGQILFVTTNLL